MNIKEMEENGTIDYYLELKNYINGFVNKNYPLSKEDFKSILENAPTDNVIQRQETYKILNESMEEILKKVQNRNDQIINQANNGNYTDFSIDEFKQEIFQMKQEMLEKLWNERHPEEQMQDEHKSENAETEQVTGELVDEIVEQGKEIEIRADEISEANIEINQAEKDFIQEQQVQQDIGMSIGE